MVFWENKGMERVISKIPSKENIMQRFTIRTAFLVAAMSALAATTAQAAEQLTEQTVTRAADLQTVEGPATTFTGKVSVTMLYGTYGEMKSSGGSVTFQPGARSFWHYHPVGQVLIVTDGVGYTQEWGKPRVEIRAGDIVRCPANVKHWHGASENSPMTHISICEEKDPGKVVVWQEAVTDEQYAGR